MPKAREDLGRGSEGMVETQEVNRHGISLGSYGCQDLRMDWTWRELKGKDGTRGWFSSVLP